jgi:hypothetical protein
MAQFKRSLDVHEAGRQAFRERTGQELQPDSTITVEDAQRCDRILKANGKPGLGQDG